MTQDTRLKVGGSETSYKSCAGHQREIKAGFLRESSENLLKAEGVSGDLIDTFNIEVIGNLARKDSAEW